MLLFFKNNLYKWTKNEEERCNKEENIFEIRLFSNFKYISSYLYFDNDIDNCFLLCII
jgi:hypothetical protein